VTLTWSRLGTSEQDPAIAASPAPAGRSSRTVIVASANAGTSRDGPSAMPAPSPIADASATGRMPSSRRRSKNATAIVTSMIRIATTWTP